MLIKQASKLLLGFAVLTVFMGGAMANEEPRYEIIKKDNDFELRRYQPMIIAEVLVTGTLSEASNKGFRQIADFIFGNNEDPIKKQSEKIAMTAPVTLEPLSGETSMQTATQWRVDFVMPRQYTLENIPKPKNSAVKLRQVPGKLFLVHKFSGLGSLSTVQQKTDEMLAWAARKGYKTIGSVQLARYDPPWTLPMFRRNEIMIEIAKP